MTDRATPEPQPAGAGPFDRPPAHSEADPVGAAGPAVETAPRGLRPNVHLRGRVDDEAGTTDPNRDRQGAGRERQLAGLGETNRGGKPPLAHARGSEAHSTNHHPSTVNRQPLAERAYGAAAKWLFLFCSRIWQAAPLRLGYAGAAVIADIVYYGFWRQKRRNVIDTMRHVLGPEASEAEVRRTAQRSVQNYFRYMADFIRFPKLTKEEIVGSFVNERWDWFRSVMDGGRGIVVVGVHMGNWDLAGAAAGLLGFRFHVIVEPFSPASLDEYIQGTRREKGMLTLPIAEAARGVIKALRDHEMVGILIDRPEPGTGVPVRFFDSVVYVPGGAATLALRTGAKVLPAALVRRSDTRFDLKLDETIEYTPTGDRPRDVQALTQLIMRSLEGFIREQPDQWYMFRQFFPTMEAIAAEGAPQLVKAEG